MVKAKKANAGGAAMSLGAEFQARVEASASVHVLGEQDAASLLGRPGVIVAIAVETASKVDDIGALYEDGGVVHVQCKRTVDLEKPAKPGKKQVPLGSAIEQFVQQFHGGATFGGAPARPFDLKRDRLVLAVGRETSSAVRVTMAKLLDRIFYHPAGQPISAVAHTDEDRRVLAVVLAHVHLAWRTAVQRAGTDAELHEFLRFVRVIEFPVEAGQDGERAAEQLLRSSILVDPSQARSAWDRLISFSLGSQGKQRSTDRAGLVHVLHPDLAVKAPRSYQADIERLRAHTRRVAEQLREFGRIPIGGSEVVLERAYGAQVRAAAEEGSLLLTGRPGAGKSGVQHGILSVLEAEGRDCVALAAQGHSAPTLVALRGELGLEHEIAEVLANWPGSEPAFLLIDALDAARGEPSARTLRELMREVARVAPRWRVVASIREYDLRYGSELHRIFAGSPPAGLPQPSLPGESLRRVRHIVVGDFNDEELAALEVSEPALHALVQSAPAELRKLIANPFNLRLAATLIESGRSPESLRSITTQIELLDAYWSARVDEGGSHANRIARHAVVRKVAAEMIRVRALRAAQTNVIDAADSAALDELLHSHVLAPWQRRPGQTPEESTLVFTHHRIFDYAVERALLRGTPIGPLLAGDTQIVLFARPSVEMHFEHLWDASDAARQDFWSEVLDVCGRPDVRGIDALVGPGVAARRAGAPQDIDALVSALAGPMPVRSAAERTVEYTLRSLLPEAGLGVELVGVDAGPWAELLVRVTGSSTVRGEVLWSTSLVLRAAAAGKAGATPEQVAAFGVAARQLLDRAWTMEYRSSGLIRRSMEAVLDFFHSSPTASSALLRRALAPEHLANHGYEELRHFDDYIPVLAALAPEFARDLYAAAFSLEPPPKTPTAMGGPIFSMSSNAAQDLGLALFVLAREFPQFLQRAPIEAATALVRVAEFHGTHAQANRVEAVGSFEFHGVTARVVSDYTELWRDKRNADEAKKLFRQLEAHLVTLAEDISAEPMWRDIVDHLVRENERASIWAVLLRAGARAPATLGEYLKPMLWSSRLLGGIDTKRGAGEFLSAMGSRLSIAERERCERAILAVAEGDFSDWGIATGALRGGLLQRLGEAGTITPEARAFLDEWHSKGAPSETDWSGVAMSRGGESEEERLARLGVPEDDANRAIRVLRDRASGIADALDRNRGDREEVGREAGLVLVTLDARLASADADGVHPALRTEAYDAFIELCAALACDASFSCGDDVGELVRTSLIVASADPRPTVSDILSPKVKDWPMLFSGRPRGSAAKGLCSLARLPECGGGDLVEAIDRLAADPVDEVRVRVAWGIAAVARAEPDLAWSIAERFATTESVPGVVAALMTGLRQMMDVDPDRVADLAIAAHRRLSAFSEAPESRRYCIDVLYRVFVVHAHAGARDYLFNIFMQPDVYGAEVSHLARAFRGMLTLGAPGVVDPVQDGLRRRSLEVITRVAVGAQNRLSAIEEEKPSESNREAWRARVSEVAGILDGIGLQVHSALGPDGDEPGPSGAQIERFYHESGLLLDVLSEVGLPSLTHHIVETLQAFIATDPRGVFLKIAKAIRVGARNGYHYDSLADTLFTGLVERFLGDHPDIFQQYEDCRDELLDLLDLFVQVGSMAAMRLTYGLRELFL